jgi:hypothetical protein
MSQRYEATGQIKIIEATQSFPSGFKKREFVITTDSDKYPQDLKFEVVKDGCDKLENFNVGDSVTVAFNLRGNEYKGKYYVGLTAWKVEANGSQGPRDRTPQDAYRKPVNQPPAPPKGGYTPDPDDDENSIPF